MPNTDAPTFTLAHLSDPHIGPLPRAQLKDLIGKRLTGYWNWHRSRRLIHDMPMLKRIMVDLTAQNPDHIALTGDLVNIGLPSEFPLALKLVEPLGDPLFVSMIPGNHDAYASNSLPEMLASFGPYMCGDDLGKVTFPYMRIRGGIALIGVSSAIPTAPFLASGAVGPTQTEKIKAMLMAAGEAGFARVVMIHHPPYSEGAHFGRGLRDAPVFEKMLMETGCELVIHGHNHVQSIHHLAGKGGKQIPVIGVASASAVPGTERHKAAYHLYHIRPGKSTYEIEMVTRGVSANNPEIRELDRRNLQAV